MLATRFCNNARNSNFYIDSSVLIRRIRDFSESLPFWRDCVKHLAAILRLRLLAFPDYQSLDFVFLSMRAFLSPSLQYTRRTSGGNRFVTV